MSEEKIFIDVDIVEFSDGYHPCGNYFTFIVISDINISVDAVEEYVYSKMISDNRYITKGVFIGWYYGDDLISKLTFEEFKIELHKELNKCKKEVVGINYFNFTISLNATDDNIDED